jgi:hypothetical protein
MDAARTQSVRDRVFGSGPACFGHRSASDAAESAYWAGLRRAWATVSACTAAAGVDLRMVATAAAIPATVPVKGILAWLTNMSSQASARFSARRERQAVRASDPDAAPSGASATASAAARDGGHPNLRMEAFRASRWPAAGQLSADGRGGPLAMAVLLGLPIWAPLGMSTPVHCRRCQAPATGSVDGNDVLAGAPAERPAGGDGVRARLDDAGEHVAVCLRGGPAAGVKRRHDNVVRSLVAVASACGREARYHDCPIFTFGKDSRPADWLEAGHVCHDLVIGARSVQQAPLRERDKVRKYAPQMALNPHLKFRPFGVEYGGEIGPAAATTVAEWARSLAAARTIAGLPVGNPTGDVRVAVGRAFVRASIAQVHAWAGFAARIISA